MKGCVIFILDLSNFTAHLKFLPRLHKAQRGQYVKISVCVWVCVVTSNFYIIDEVIEVDEIDKANISTAAAKKDKYWKGELSYVILKHN